MANVGEIKWAACTNALEHNIRPPLERAITIVPGNVLSGLVIYVGVSAFNPDDRVTDDDLRRIAQQVEEKLNQ